jgi:hypothetical protein
MRTKRKLASTQTDQAAEGEQGGEAASQGREEEGEEEGEERRAPKGGANSGGIAFRPRGALCPLSQM